MRWTILALFGIGIRQRNTANDDVKDKAWEKGLRELDRIAEEIVSKPKDIDDDRRSSS